MASLVLVVDKDRLLRHQQVLVITRFAARAVVQLVVDSLVRITAVQPQNSELRHVVKLVGKVLCAGCVGVHVPVVGWVAEREDAEVREHHGADLSVGVGVDLFEGQAEEEAALGVGDHDDVSL